MFGKLTDFAKTMNQDEIMANLSKVKEQLKDEESAASKGFVKVKETLKENKQENLANQLDSLHSMLKK